jgi:hypothetical protein
MTDYGLYALRWIIAGAIAIIAICNAQFLAVGATVNADYLTSNDYRAILLGGSTSSGARTLDF